MPPGLTTGPRAYSKFAKETQILSENRQKTPNVFVYKPKIAVKMDGADARTVAEKELGEEPESTEEIVGGAMNKTLRIEYNENSYILQINDSAEAHEMKNNIKSFQYFQSSKVPVPQTVTKEVKKYGSSHYIIVEDLNTNTLNSNITSKKTRNAGKYLAHVHNSQTFNKAGWWEWEDQKPKVVGFPEGPLKHRIENNLEDNLAYFREQDIDWLAEASDRFLDHYIDLIPTDFTPVFVHHDYNPGNVLTENRRVTGILDFDYAHSSHGQRDLVKAANNFWIRGEVDRKHMYEGYAKVREINESFTKNEPLYRLETLIDILKNFVEHDQISAEETKEHRQSFEEIESTLEQRI
jgi:aminoglycoside phosphotransferase (APT) family kinase protein